MLLFTKKSLLLAAISTAVVQADNVSFDDVSDLLGFFEFGQTNLISAAPISASVAGMAWFDYDNDGDLDLFICSANDRPNALFRNDVNENNNGSAFTDVTASAGLAATMATCVTLIAADFDNDGHLDLFVGPDLFGTTGFFMYRNNGDSTFEDVTSTAGFPPSFGNGGGAAGDYDGDGYLDIFVPGTLSLPDLLFKNNGDFTFTDVSVESGISNSVDLNSCSSIFADFTGDGLSDILVGVCIGGVFPTLLWINNGDGTFTRTIISTPLNGMGLAAGDIDNDGDLDIFITGVGTNLFDSGHLLLINGGSGNFVDTIATSGIPITEFGWSATFTDFDNDGNLDLMFTGSGLAPNLFNFNKGRLLFGDGAGHFVEAPTCGPDDCTPCTPFGAPGATETNKQPNLCYAAGFGCDARDLGTTMWAAPFEDCNLSSFCDGCYRTSDCSILSAEEAACVPALGVDFTSSRSTTVASGDFDGDGYNDLAVMTSDYSADYQLIFGTPTPVLSPGAITHIVLLKNGAESANNFIKLKVVGLSGNRSGVGSKLVVNDGTNVQYGEVQAISSPMTSTNQWPTFGLGQEDAASVVVTWHPSGLQEKFCVNANEMTEIVEGDGRSTNAVCPFEVGGNGNGNSNGNRNGNSNGNRNGLSNVASNFGG